MTSDEFDWRLRTSFYGPFSLIKLKSPLQELELRRKTLGERLQRYHALNHMCNQFKRWARRHGRVTSWPRCSRRQLSVIQQSSVCASVTIYESYLLSSNIESSSMSKAEAKHKGKSSSRYRLCVPPCPRYISSGDTHGLCVVCLGAKHRVGSLYKRLPLRTLHSPKALWGERLHRRSSRCRPHYHWGGAAAGLMGITDGSGGGNEDGRASIFFLSSDPAPALWDRKHVPRFFSSERGLDAPPVFLRLSFRKAVAQACCERISLWAAWGLALSPPAFPRSSALSGVRKPVLQLSFFEEIDIVFCFFYRVARVLQRKRQQD